MNSDQQTLLQAIWDSTVTEAAWPNFRQLDNRLWRQNEIDVTPILKSVSTSLVHGGRGFGGADPQPDEQISLTILGLAACAGSGKVIDAIVRALHAGLAAAAEVADNAVASLTADLVIPGASDGGTRRADSPETSRFTRLVGLVLAKEPWTNPVSLYEDGWQVGIDRSIRKYREAATIDQYLELREGDFQGVSALASRREQGAQVASRSMEPQRALRELQRLRAESTASEIRRPGPAHKSWKAKADALLAAALGGDSHTLKEFRDVRYTVGIWTGSPGEDERDAQYFAARVDDAAALLDAGIYELEQQLPETNRRTHPAHNPDGPIFIVHGRDDARRHEVARVLERVTGKDVVILHEQASRGGTIIEKLEHHAQSASFAVALLTGDDLGGLNAPDAPQHPRARQNVIFEVGVFFGLLGRENVAVLIDESVERPSDLEGLVYISLDKGGAWHIPLMRELEGAGLSVDRNRLP